MENKKTKKTKLLMQNDKPVAFRLTKENKVYLRRRGLLDQFGRASTSNKGRLSRYCNILISRERIENMEENISVNHAVVLYELVQRQEERDLLNEEIKVLAKDLSKLTKKK